LTNDKQCATNDEARTTDITFRFDTIETLTGGMMFNLQNLFATRFEEYDENKIIYDQKPIRLFKSRFLEAFTHVHPVMVVILFMPVVIYSLLVSSLSNRLLPLAILAGLCLWTLTEYLGHRFFFHYEPQSVWGKRLIFLFHGIHHVQPHIKTRLVMPPAVSVPTGVLFAVLFNQLGIAFGVSEWVSAVFAGFVLGYIGYDLLHYAEHHLPMKGPILKFLKRHHMEHHYKTPKARFGVSTNVWDQVFQTEPVK
jgi:sterol desaturase/sphingolipid hydroxylase (fatty acid hydroxylase superfamily)